MMGRQGKAKAMDATHSIRAACRRGGPCAAAVALAWALAWALPPAALAGTSDEPPASAMQAEPRIAIAIARAAHVDPQSAAAIEIMASRPRAGRDAGEDGALAPARPAGMPLAAAVITSGYGYRVNPVTGQWAMHRGVDLAAAAGTPVTATADGTVALAGWAGSYGILVAIRHGNGAETRYAHLSALAVGAGERVRKGDVIGYVGSTGRSTGPHLHYEVRQGPNALDPVPGLGR